MVEIPFFAPTQFQSDGFILRCYRQGDGPALREAALESYDHLRPWMPWAVTEEDVAIVEARCQRFLANYLTNTEYVIGIWDGDRLLGGTGFHLRHGTRESGNAEIGMWIRQSASHRGLGTRALAAMLEWGFTEWNWHRLIWKCDTRNIGSARVAEKSGMRLEGVFRSDALDVEGNRRDTNQFAILADEWKSPRRKKIDQAV